MRPRAGESPIGRAWSQVELPTAHELTLIPPVAVRIVDLDAPLADLWLPPARAGGTYRSLLAIARFEGEPLSSAALSVEPDGRVPRELLEFGLRRGLGGRLDTPTAPAGQRVPRTPVSVVVTTCCDPDALERCLGSVFSCEYEQFEVIVVENRPGSGATRRMLAERFGDAPRSLRYVEEHRPGLSRARNAGLEAADGELVAFTDDDTVVDPGWVGRSALGFERGQDVDCVTGLILPLELETESQLLLDQFAGFGKGFERRIYRLPETRNGHPLYPYAPGTIGSGANTVVRRRVARAHGGFDISLGAGTQAAGGEDLDLYIRLLLAGHGIAYEPSAIVWHEHPDGPERLRRQVYRYGVGLGAMLAKQLLLGPARLELLRATPAGLQHAADRGSRKNAAKSAAYPRRLDWLERAGMVAGPVAYVRSASATLRRRRSDARPSPEAVEHDVFLPGGRAVKVASFAYESPVRRAPQAGPAGRAVNVAATLACVAAPVAVALALPAAVRLPAVLALLCLAPGAAVVKALRGTPELGLVLGASLGASALVAQSMLWLGTWWPEAFVYLLAAVCLALLTSRQGAESLRARVRSSGRRISADVIPHLAVIAAALAAWGSSVAGADVDRMAGTGLLDALPAGYFLAFALLLGGFAVAVSRPTLEPRLLAVYVVALVVVLHGTTPLLYDEPRYSWVFPHLGVISFIAESGAVDRGLDIYNNWPAFFALGAWFTRLTGVAPSAYAEWAQVFFTLAGVAALRFALRGMTGNERLLWTATALFVLGNWVAQDYLAPQAFAYVLALVILGLALRLEVRSLVPRTRPGLWLAGGLGRLRALLPHGRRIHEPRPPSPLSPRGALVAGGVCYLAVVVSHQLTPVVLILAIAALAVVGRRLPLWVPVVMAAVEAAWLWLAWPYLSERYDLLDPDPGSSAAPAGYELGAGLPGLELVAWAGRVELLLLGALAVIGVARRLGSRRWDLAAAILVVAPLLIIGLQSYGGEGRYRFYLFALPWLCFFAAAACWPVSARRLPAALRAWRPALVLGALGVCMLFAYYGLELSNRLRSEDVRAAAWFERHAPPGSLLVGVAENFPRRLSARYPEVYDPSHPGAPALLDSAAFRGRPLGRRDLPRVEAYVRGFGARHTYLILTSNQERLARLYGLLPPRAFDRLGRALRASRRFRPVYARDGAAIFRYRPLPEERAP